MTAWVTRRLRGGRVPVIVDVDLKIVCRYTLTGKQTCCPVVGGFFYREEACRNG